MSGRGRGRGRGGGGGPRSVSQQYLLSSAQEAGFDVRNLRTSSTGMFSDFELHSSGERRLHQHETKTGQQMADVGASNVKQEPGAAASSVAAASTEQPRSPETIYLISKTRELHHKFQSSVFYVRSAKLETMPDVVRYSDRLRPPSNVDAGAVLSHCLGGRKRTLGDHGGVFVPEELCGGQRRVRSGSNANEADAKKLKGIDLDDLDDKKNGDDDEEKDEDEDGFREDDGEESEGADYVANYYESADESGGSDGEPTF
eukprot:CAMPEP_0201738320 /NCGR_PEP_ID=MMETSP0593-20130828/44765_1 /ASSEMBLY_ACC=CAM_ASM_000672 /TAXON_ID=267983 /ORGANISM="Skeletonema japonicum, Strain CCMP2506" /LENGTH=257 /DNA_ID=CAMNT_0048232503 /DNA_START=44 /DNA_END=817 /DNA_ORIENTATION=+